MGINHEAKGRNLSIELKEREDAPRYEQREWKELEIKKAIITEKGTMGNLPIVDLQLEDEKGNKYFVMATGRIIIGLGDACKGVMQRIHGTDTPGVD